MKQQIPPPQQSEAEGATAWADPMTSASEAIAKNIFMISFHFEWNKNPAAGVAAAKLKNSLGARRRHRRSIGPRLSAAIESVPLELGEVRFQAELTRLQKELEANLHVAAGSAVHSGRGRARGEVFAIRAQQLPSVTGRAALSMANGLASIVTSAKAIMLSNRTVLRIEESVGIASVICMARPMNRADAPSVGGLR